MIDAESPSPTAIADFSKPKFYSSPLLPGTAYRNSDYDVQYNFNLDYVYQLPTSGLSAVMRHLIGGWTLAGTLFFHTGLPWNPVSLASRLALGNVTGLRNAPSLATFAGGTDRFVRTQRCGSGSRNWRSALHDGARFCYRRGRFWRCIYSKRNALKGSTLAARPAGTALANRATSATPRIANI